MGGTVKLVRYRVAEGIALVALSAAPSNALTPEVRTALSEVLDKIIARGDVHAVALTGEGPNFSAGIDLRDEPPKSRIISLGHLCAKIESMPMPVVAGLHGSVSGEGMALMLAAHYRLAARNVDFSLPEVALGLMPSGGITQRLPRLIGAEAALSLMLSGGQPVPVEQAPDGLVDGVIDGPVRAITARFCQDLIAKSARARPTRDADDRVLDGTMRRAVAPARKRLAASKLFAPGQIVDCVEAAAILPFDVGCAFEDERAKACRAHDQSRALRHLFIGERTISQDLLAADTATGRRRLTPGGEVIVRGFLRAYVIAARALVDRGHDPNAVDGALIAYGFRKGPLGAPDPAPSDRAESIVRRVLAALLAEGARVLRDGDVASADQADVLAVRGLGMPRWTGGPMHAAAHMGLLGLRNDMRIWAGQNEVWTVPPLLDQAVKYAAGFDAPEVLAQCRSKASEVSPG